MSGIIGSKFNIRGSGRVAKLGTDGQVLTSSGAGKSAVYEDAAAGGTSWQSVVTASTLTAVAGNGYPINTTSTSAEPPVIKPNISVPSKTIRPVCSKVSLAPNACVL